jgi:hypothetical protein
MTNTIRTIILAGAAAFCFAGFNSARADVMRVAVVIADSPADYQANAALLPAFVKMLKAATGAKDVSSGTDAANNAIMTTSVFPNAAAVTALTGSDAWKAEAAKLKAKSYTINVFDLSP